VSKTGYIQVLVDQSFGLPHQPRVNDEENFLRSSISMETNYAAHVAWGIGSD